MLEMIIFLFSARLNSFIFFPSYLFFDAFGTSFVLFFCGSFLEVCLNQCTCAQTRRIIQLKKLKIKHEKKNSPMFAGLQESSPFVPSMLAAQPRRVCEGRGKIITFFLFVCFYLKKKKKTPTGIK